MWIVEDPLCEFQLGQGMRRILFKFTLVLVECVHCVTHAIADAYSETTGTGATTP